jgi:hypothetical protein
MSLAKCIYEFAAARDPDNDLAKWWSWVKENAFGSRGFYLPPGVWNTGEFDLPPGWTFNDWLMKEKRHGKEESKERL